MRPLFFDGEIQCKIAIIYNNITFWLHFTNSLITIVYY